MSGRDGKAQRYIALLDTARVNGTWNELPELIRKVKKHAPERKCLISTAVLEHDIAQQTTASARGSSATDVGSITNDSLNKLSNEVHENHTKLEEAIQGRSALIWAWYLDLGTNSDFIIRQATIESASSTQSLWTKICIVKTAYMKGMAFSHQGNHPEAEAVYKTVIPFLMTQQSTIVSTPQYLYWTQQLSGQLALSEARKPREQSDSQTDGTVLQAFRNWAFLSAKSRDQSSTTYGHIGPKLSNLRMWNAYYTYLSADLRTDHGSNSSNVAAARTEQAAEIRRVETSYENELLHHIKFPTATQSNTIVEDWVEQVIHNWQILSGPRWREENLGEDGTTSLTRNVLDILYRAAMKSFHSTLILRRLYQVHKALAEFDLAFKALDTYLELVNNGFSRSLKSGEPRTGQDNDAIVLETLSDGVETRCAFGRREDAEKAHELCIILEATFDQIIHYGSQPSLDKRANGIEQQDHASREKLMPRTIYLVHRALGIGKAHWAKWTTFNENRSALQSEAVVHLATAVAQPIAETSKLPAIYAFTLLLAETREIDKAIELAKTALNLDKSAIRTPQYALERQSIPMWHLLALLLSTRQDYNIAEQSCAAALEQFPSTNTLFGSERRRARNNANADKEEDRGLVDDMECDELQRIIELRITELALTELAEGAEHALNSSNDLLALFLRLFGHLGVVTDDKASQKTLEPPKSSATTVKSLRGSIFGKRRLPNASEIYSEKTNGTVSANTDLSRPTTQATQAPTIQITDEDEKASPHKHHIFRRSLDKMRDEKKHTRPARHEITAARGEKVDSTLSSQRQSFETSQEQPMHSETSTTTARPHLETIRSAEEVPAVIEGSAEHQDALAVKRVANDSSDMESHDPAPLPQDDLNQPSQRDVKLPSALPDSSESSPMPKLPKAMAQKHALTVLTKIWLVVAKLYRRANMFDDSREATDEAAKAALRVETLVANIESSARAFADPGWGAGGKSSDEVWADVCCERASLLLGIARAREEKDDIHDDEGFRDAVDQYEQCLMYYPDHSEGIVGLSNLLLDYYERKIELGRKVDDGHQKQRPDVKEFTSRDKRTVSRVAATNTANGIAEQLPSHQPELSATDDDLKKTPENLNRLAARDRAYGLLSTLTKLGSGWDNSEAWFALARAHDLGGEIEKARDILWWCVDLEDSRPIRHWNNLGSSGYVL